MRRRRTTINIFWPVLYLVVAAADWTAVYRDWIRATYFTKPAVLLVLILWFTLAGGWEGQLFWFGMALVFSLAGDVLLQYKGLFTAGLLAFLLAHVFYIVGLNPNSIPITPVTVVMAVAAWALMMVIYRRMSAAIKPKPEFAMMQYPVFVYCLAISIMLLSALVTLVRPDWPRSAAALVSAGGALFMLSDGLLAENRFVRCINHCEFYVRITYHLAQLAIIAGVLIRYGKL